MDVRDIVKAVRLTLQEWNEPVTEEWNIAQELITEAKLYHPQDFQTVLDNLDQIISYYSQNPEGTAHNG